MTETARTAAASQELLAAVEMVARDPSTSDEAHLLPWAELKRLAAAMECAGYDPGALSAQTIATAAETLVLLLPCSARSVRRCAVRLLRLLVGASGPRALQPQVSTVVGLLQHREWGVRCAAIETLKLVPGLLSPACATRLVVQLTHPDWGTRQVALEGLALLEPEALSSVAVQILALLERLDWEVRRGALRLLASLTPGSLAPLASTIYDMRTTIGPEVDHLLRPAAASMLSVRLVDDVE